MKTSTFIKCALIGTSIPFFAGCVEREVVYRNPPPAAPAGTVVEADPVPPPPQQVDVMTVAPGPVDLWFWAPGSWEWRGGGWVWFGGHWAARPHPGAVWVGGGWAHRGHGRVWVRAHWR
jgi:hypothetical protein